MTRREIHSLQDVLMQFGSHSHIGPIARMWAVTMQEAFTENASSSTLRKLQNQCLTLLESMFDADVAHARAAELIDVKTLLFFMTSLKPHEYDKLAQEALKQGFIRKYRVAEVHSSDAPALPVNGTGRQTGYYGLALMF